MKQTVLRRSGLQVSCIAFGAWQLGGDWGPTDERAAVAAIRRAADGGLTLFDTAQAYGFGASEQLLAKALEPHRHDDLVVATKGGLRSEGGGVVRDSSPEAIRSGVEESLKALGREAIDLYQVHWPDPSTPLDVTAATLADLVGEGKIRHVGVSNYDAKEMASFNAVLPVETLQPPYSLFRRDIEHEILPYTSENDIGVLVYGPLAHGLLSGGMDAGYAFDSRDWRRSSSLFRGEPFQRNLEVVPGLETYASTEFGVTVSQLAIAWTLAHPAVDVAIVGTRNAEHVDDALEAADLELDRKALAHIDDLTSGAVPVSGPSPETV